MSRSIGFYCGPSDTVALQEFARSLGLVLAPLDLANPADEDPRRGPYCYLSAVPLAELHPYGSPPTRIVDVRDPLLRFMRSVSQPPHLSLGHIQWSDDVEALAAKTKPYFDKLSKWIRANWKRYGSVYGVYIGPEANMLRDAGAKLVNFLPEWNTVLRTIETKD